MTIIRYIFSPRVLYTILIVLALTAVYLRIIGLNLKSEALDKSKKILIKRLQRDEENYIRNIQMERIGKGSKGVAKTYRELIQNVIISMKLDGITVENFTTFFGIFGVISWIGFSTAFDSLFIGALVAIPSIFAVIALVLSATKNSVRANDNRVMDSLDIICPTIENSVFSAITSNMNAFDNKIKIHYKNFVHDISSRDMSLREAITELNRKLGPRFDEFARKAILFHDAGEEGMNEIFMDVVEMNSYTRSINAKADIVFQQTNFNMLASGLIVVGFIWYAYNNPMTSDIMRNTLIGRLATAVSIAMIIMMYAVGQITQMSIDYNKIKSDK